jgi:hypothetical protein
MATLADIYNVKTRFHRSVDLLQDAGRVEALDGYVLTQQASDLARRIAEGLITSSTERAWALTGPYGAGKSAFALFLASLLGHGETPAHDKALALLRGTPARGAIHTTTASKLAATYRKQPRGFLVVLVSGSRQALVPALLDGISRAVRLFFGSKAKGRAYVEEVEALAKKRGRGPSEEAVCDLLQRLAADASAGGGLGLLLLVDEFGKFLEHAAANPAQGDVFVLQRVAELAVRSDDCPIGVVTVLHQAFERYAANLPPTTRDEWRKIQGRFQDVAFVEEAGQLLTLIGSAVGLRATVPAELRAHAESIVDTGITLGLVPQGLRETYLRAFPLHPTTTAVLPGVFRSALAQNERSLFSFLAARYDHGFAGFLAQTEPRTNGSALYRIDLLHDYLKETMGPALLAISDSKRWAEIEDAIERIPRGASALAVRVIKAVGLLTLFGTPEVRASWEILAYSLEDGSAPSAELTETIATLERASIIIFRRHRGAFGLWEGSDIDIDERFRLSRERVLSANNLLATVRRRARLHPLVARRHFFTTGTLRFFEVEVASVHELEAAASRATEDGDGRIIYLLPTSDETQSELRRAAENTTGAMRKDRMLVLVAVPENAAVILGAAADLDAWLEVRQVTAELAGDAIARRELSARIATAEQRLDAALGDAFGWGERDTDTTSEWFHVGRKLSFSPRELTEELSRIFDKAFDQAPYIHNELLNRRNLSSAAAAARRVLVDHMLANASEERLGIEGFPPEFSMYASVLLDGGLHQRVGDRFNFAAPGAGNLRQMRPVWDAITEFLDATDGHRRTLKDLRSKLRAPPFGVKDGPFPILLFAVIAADPAEFALFEEGTFLTDITGAVVERLLRRIEQFEIARYRLDAGRLDVLRALAHVLKIEDKEPPPVEIAKTLVRWVGQLPKYTRGTRRIAGGALLVRDAVLAARDPLKLLFHDLPQALDLSPIEHGVGSSGSELGAAYASRLTPILRELADAYPTLLQQIERSFATALNLSHSGEAFRSELSERAVQIGELASDQRLRAFLGRAKDSHPGFVEWLEGVTMVVGNRPPTEWADAEFERFEIGLAELRALFFRAEDLALDQQTFPAGANGVVELMRISLTAPGRKEVRQMLHLRAADGRAVEHAEKEILRVLEEKFHGRRDTWAAVLGRMIHNFLDMGRDDASHSGSDTKKLRSP